MNTGTWVWKFPILSDTDENVAMIVASVSRRPAWISKYWGRQRQGRQRENWQQLRFPGQVTPVPLISAMCASYSLLLRTYSILEATFWKLWLRYSAYHSEGGRSSGPNWWTRGLLHLLCDKLSSEGNLVKEVTELDLLPWLCTPWLWLW